jgi:hypothetical protein
MALAVTGISQLNPGDGTASQPGNMRHVFATCITGPTQTSATVTFRIAGSGTGRAGSSFDGFTFNALPEPSTILPLELGLGVLAWARRRAAYRSATVEGCDTASRRMLSRR